jgi:hypothetical protein
MADIRVIYDERGRTLTVWFGDPEAEHICEETVEEVILMKDAANRVIGFEKPNFTAEDATALKVGFHRIEIKGSLDACADASYSLRSQVP